jgi:hypothetical protein
MTRARVLVRNYRSDANSERGLAVYGYTRKAFEGTLSQTDKRLHLTRFLGSFIF